jgi:hypothetical protein
MFSQFLNSFDALLEEAKVSPHVVKKDHYPIYEAIENYVKEHKLVISNPETLIQQDKSSFSSYTIYGDNIFRHANNLANAIAKLTIFVLMFTNEKNEHFTIKVNGVYMIQLYNIPRKLRKLIVPVRKGDLLLYPPEFELINIYHKLYSPHFADEWETLDTWKNIIQKQLHDRKTVIGGKPKSAVEKFSGNFIDNKLILQWLRGRSDYVLVGTNAINILNESKNCKYFQKIQIVTSAPIDKITSEIDNLIFQFTGYRTFQKTHSANIHIEPRLKKTVVSVRLGKRCIHLLDIFNNAQFELVPYTTFDGVDIGYPNVLKMFMLVDMWFLRILYALDIVNDNSLKSGVHAILTELDRVDTIEISKYDKETYLGSYASLARYTQKKGVGNVFYPYNPEQTRYNKGSYRTV